MNLSYSVKKNVFETAVGGLMNKLHLHKRRDTLIFADIFTSYIKACEDAGHGEEMKKIAQKWMILYFNALVPDILKKMPPMLFLNDIMKRVWINLGLMDDLNFVRKDDIIEVNTESEGITKFIGKNDFSVGLFIGVLNMAFNSQVDVIETSQTKEKSRYVFKLTKEERPNFKSKEKDAYFKMNFLPTIKGFTLKDAFESGTFKLEEKNKIYFREKYLYPIENTVFHFLSNEKILFETIPEISYNYFKEIMKESEDKEKLTLLKTLLQVMGWGVVTIVIEENKINIEIKNPPSGLQAENDNWGFMIQIILGYLWLLNKKVKIKNIKDDNNRISMSFSK